MDISYWEGVNKKKIRELIEPYKDVFPELMKLIKKFDHEINNITNNAHLEISLNLGEDGNNVYRYNYYAIINPDSADIMADEYTDWEAQNGISRKIQLATVYF